MNELRRIGLLGGTFDPIHFGHLRTAWEIYHALNLAEIRLIPCYLPPHRAAPAASAIDRLTMVKTAIATTPHFVADDREICREGLSYTIDTLRSLSRELNGHSLCLIIGTDAFLSFEQWHEWEEIVKLANVVVMHRPGHQESIAPRLKNAFRLVDSAEELSRHSCGALFFQSVTLLGISATAIRAEIKKYGCAPFLLPKDVCDYIAQEKLYCSL